MRTETEGPAEGCDYFCIRLEYIVPLSWPVLQWRQAGYPTSDQIRSRVQLFAARHDTDLFQLARCVVIVIEEFSADTPVHMEVQCLAC